ncbi:phage holin family protein [Flavobacteriaceae bacterium S356]|uniref:Phage holin family protein n=1 Tax=Asprobacillus argus TaxID=3076534 RepID=A0ABU3LF70_9FLAO|nr:phage holin family protein [Flavobacteriaceae bacterium S356]
MDKVSNISFWLLTMIIPLSGVIFTVILLIVVDFITGSYASYMNGIGISSKRIGHTISKLFIYNLVIISAHFLETNIVDEIPFLKIIAGFIAITEIRSILENYTKIYGVNPFKVLLQFIKTSSFKEILTFLSSHQRIKKIEKEK